MDWDMTRKIPLRDKSFVQAKENRESMNIEAEWFLLWHSTMEYFSCYLEKKLFESEDSFFNQLSFSWKLQILFEKQFPFNSHNKSPSLSNL